MHGIFRENDPELTVPEDLVVKILVRDPHGTEIKNTVMKPNSFGTVAFEYGVPSDAPIGHYTVEIESVHPQDALIENALLDFQVSVPKKSSFIPTVFLSSRDLEGNIPTNLKKIPNVDDVKESWYREKYTANITLEGVVEGKYENGEIVRNMSFTYKLSKKKSYDASSLENCIFSCFFDSSITVISE